MKKEIIFKEGMNLSELSSILNIPVKDFISKLFMHKKIINQNQPLDIDMIELLALEYDFDFVKSSNEDKLLIELKKDDIRDEDLEKRYPIVTIMGHVDHGKTTLLDTIRNSRITAKEAGGITQHIGAYQVSINDSKITFIDTPGHEAFSSMRQRGASITDIVILVVAADDGVMPQTKEAIDHAKAANCPIIVAINKMDKKDANKSRVMEELVNYGLVAEEWGGDTIFVPISALKSEGIDELLENVLLLSDMLELKASKKGYAVGTVIESGMDKNKGPYATFLIEHGTLSIQDSFVAGSVFGKVRTMSDDRLVKYQTAGPSDTVLITGLSEVCQAGDRFKVFKSEKEAKNIASIIQNLNKEKLLSDSRTKSIEELFNNTMQNKQLNIIIKADAHGSIEALKASILKVKVKEDIKINIVRASVSSITEDDLNLASSSMALIIGFNVRPLPSVRISADNKGVEIRLYSIIYDVINDIENILKGMLEPEFKEEVTGFCEVRNIFKSSQIGTIAGCYVTQGVINNDSKIRVLRDGKVIYEGEIETLKRFKNDAKEVKEGYECGIKIKSFNDIKENDVFEASRLKEVKNG